MRALRNFTYMMIGFGCVVAFPGCACDKTKVTRESPADYGRPLGPGEVALRKITDPALYPDFSEGYNRRKGLEQAAQYNLEYLSKSSSQKFYPYLDITHDRAVQSNEAFIQVLHTANSAEEFDRVIKERFEVYESRGWNDKGDVLFTGYYRPIFDARMQPEGEFRYPLYKKPPDLERDLISDKYQRAGGGQYFTRADVNSGALAGKGLELCYLKDPFEAYIVTVQGSGKLRMADGSFFEIGYHGDNGHEYKSIGQRLIEEQKIQREELSLPGLIRFFKENPGELRTSLDYNPRYVFFTQRSGGPFGSLNVPVTPFRTIATDKQVYPRASVAFLDTQVPARNPDRTITNYTYRGFAMDQDTGGAIRAAGRCDFFLGTGDEVGELAGRTLSEGKLYYIFVKPQGADTAALASPSTPPAPVAQPTGDPGFDGVR